MVLGMAPLAACQTWQQRPLEYLPDRVEDYQRSDFVENQVLVIQTCLRNRRIDVKTLKVQLPNDRAPQTLCQERQSRGLPCPANWERDDPVDSLPRNSTLVVPVWVSSGEPQDIVGNWIPTFDVKRGKVNSTGSALSYLKTKTTTYQPVFEHVVNDPQRLFAWEVSLDVVRNAAAKRASFWFQPPKDIRLNEFTDWRLADVEEPDHRGASYGIAMANGAHFPHGAVGPDSPFVRYGLFTYRKYKDGNRLYQLSAKHAHYEAMKVFDRGNGKFQVLNFGASEVPPC